jgi:hypothetical protein
MTDNFISAAKIQPPGAGGQAELGGALPLYFLPPAWWWAAALRLQEESGAPVRVSSAGAYRKQTYRNRAVLRGGEALQTIVLPVADGRGHPPYAEALLSTAEPWQRQISRLVASVLRRAAYFEHYGPELLAILAAPRARLVDLNWALLNWQAAAMGLRFLLINELATDPKSQALWQIGPGDVPGWFAPRPFVQVFPGFDGQVSGADWLMNLGPRAADRLREATDGGAEIFRFAPSE